MGEASARTKPIATILTVIALLLTTVSLTYALTTDTQNSGLAEKMKVTEAKVQELEVLSAVTMTRLDALQGTVDKIETTTDKTQELVQKYLVDRR